MHTSVLLNETIDSLNLNENSVVVDCTVGYGGHSIEILKRIKRGWLFAFDQDEDAVIYSEKLLTQISDNYEVISTNFVNIKKELNKRDIYKVDAILFDLGVSSPQLDEGDRGFSYHQDSELDMRMDKNNKVTAKYIVNEYTYEQLVHIFYKYGEEKYSKSIANNICKYRETKEISNTLELVEIIKNSVPMKYRREKHPARRIFQALRIEVNDELNVFRNTLEDCIELLNQNGRLCIITFHSLEEKICKEFINKYGKINKIFDRLPEVPKKYMPSIKLTSKIKPDKLEIETNNRARSAKLFVIEKIGV